MILAINTCPKCVALGATRFIGRAEVVVQLLPRVAVVSPDVIAIHDGIDEQLVTVNVSGTGFPASSDECWMTDSDSHVVALGRFTGSSGTQGRCDWVERGAGLQEQSVYISVGRFQHAASGSARISRMTMSEFAGYSDSGVAIVSF